MDRTDYDPDWAAVMASVSMDVMEYMGETLQTDWSDVNSSGGIAWFDAFAENAKAC